MTARIDQYAVFFRKLDLSFSSPSEITQDSMFRCFSADGLRRSSKPFAYVVKSLGFSWSPQQQEDLIERRRIKKILLEAREESWSEEIVPYQCWLESAETPRSLLTIRTYLNAALRLLKDQHRKNMAKLANDAFARFLVRHPGFRASLAPFIRYLNETHSLGLMLPQRKKVDQRRLQKTAENKVKNCLVQLRLDQPTPRKVAHAVELLSVLYQLPRKKILSLPADALITSALGRSPAIVVDGVEYLLDKTVASLVGACLLPRGDNGDRTWLFQGKNGLAPLTEAAVRHHVKP